MLELNISRTEIVSTGPTEEHYLHIYPNPVSGKLNIEASELISSLELIDTNGRVLETSSVNSTNKTIDLTEFTDGIYYLKITQEKEISVKKIVKQ